VPVIRKRPDHGFIREFTGELGAGIAIRALDLQGLLQERPQMS
jgi:hypothetical protein